MDYLKEILRLIHILGGMYWFGAVLAMYYFITPTVAATGDAGQQFMRHLGGKSGFSTSILVAALSGAVAGAWLDWIDSNGLQSDWIKSSSACSLVATQPLFESSVTHSRGERLWPPPTN